MYYFVKTLASWKFGSINNRAGIERKGKEEAYVQNYGVSRT